jgi:hypothetical protein
LPLAATLPALALKLGSYRASAGIAFSSVLQCGWACCITEKRQQLDLKPAGRCATALNEFSHATGITAETLQSLGCMAQFSPVNSASGQALNLLPAADTQMGTMPRQRGNRQPGIFRD